MKLLPLLLVLAGTLSLCSQPDTSALLKAVETGLQNNTLTISQALTNKNYAALHPLTEFRVLIRRYSNASPVRIAMDTEPGKRIRVLAHLQTTDGAALPGVLIYFYQTDARGWYAADKPHVGGNSGDQQHARLFGYAMTDVKGNIELQTVKPSGYPQSDLPAHIHVEVTGIQGYDPLITEFLFDDDPRLTGNIRQEAEAGPFLIQKPQPATAPFVQQFSYTLVLTNH